MSAKHEYNTRQGETILACLSQNAGRHLSADDICALLRERGEQVGRTTVYRRLERFCRDGLVRKISAGDGRGACFQYSGGGDCADHYHMICTECERLIHLDCSELDELAAHLRGKHDFELDTARTVIYGKCKDCINKKGETK